LKVNKKRNVSVKVSQGRLHDILPKEYSETFPEVLWGLKKEMPTNNESQSDIATHKTDS